MSNALNQSSFRELRLAAGYSQAALAEQLSVPRETLTGWENGNRPSWRYVQAIADLCHIVQSESIAVLWREHLDEPCPCGCGGRKALPQHHDAKCLGIELECEKCGKVRFHRHRSVGHHRQLCGHCWNTSARVKRIEFTCVGYDDHHAKNIHARKCFSKKSLMPSQIRKYPKKESSKIAFIDEATATFRCARCSSAARAIARLERQIKTVTDEPIQSRTQRQEIARDYITALFPGRRRFEHGSNTLKHIANFAILRSNTSDKGRRNRVVGRLRREWSRNPLPDYNFGRCVVCHKIVIARSGRAALFHGKCHSDWQRTPEGMSYYTRMGNGEKPTLPKRRGQPVSAVNLKMYFSWVIQHYLGGKSYRDIAAENHVHFSTVKEKIDFVLANLPNPELLQSSFRLRISLLIAAANIVPAAA